MEETGNIRRGHEHVGKKEEETQKERNVQNIKKGARGYSARGGVAVVRVPRMR